MLAGGAAAPIADSNHSGGGIDRPAAAVAGDNGLIDLERGVVVLLEAADGSLDERAEVGDVGGGGEAVVEVVGEGPHPDIVFCEDGTRGRGRPQELSDVLRARALL
jgi:hypothetical protein